MLEDTPTGSDNEPTSESAPAKKAAARTGAAKKAPAKKAAATTAKKATARKTAAKKVATASADAPSDTAGEAPAAKKTAAKKATTAKKAAPAKKTAAKKAAASAESADAGATAGTALLFQAPDAAQAPARKPRKKAATAGTEDGPEVGETTKPTVTTRTRSAGTAKKAAAAAPQDPPSGSGLEPESRGSGAQEADDDSGDGARRRRRRGGRRRRKPGGEGEDAQEAGQPSGVQKSGGQKSGGQNRSGQGKAETDHDQADADDDFDSTDDESSSSSRRRRRRRRAGEEGGDAGDDPQNTVTKVRKTRSAEDQITAVAGSTRLEAKKQRRREGREAGRRRAPIVSEAEFLARRESVERVMAIRQRDDLTQIAVIEDKVLVEHYVARESQTSLIGNVYLGRVQNVLPSMEAAFIDIGKGRNAVLYAGEVNWSALGHKEGQPRKIESVLSSGQAVLVQVTKDPVGHKGARLSSQISLAGRFLVYVPDGTNSGISRKLPDTERNRLKTLLKEIVPDGAGVIVRTAAEGASEDELTRDVERLTARWADIEKKAGNKQAGAQLLYGEPDLMLKVVRDLFTEDFVKLVVQGEEAWETVQGYVTHVAPDLEERLEKYDTSRADLFTTYRIDEQIHKGLDRKVWLPSGGSLVIDRTEAMTVVDVNTGKFTGSGGNLEETVTKNNLEAAEEIVRQLRLRDIGGIIVVDFIDMVLESNRDLVLRRLVECLGRDRTRHQVAEVTSLGLVQMTRKRIGTGLLEVFSENCDHCNGRGVVIADAPVEPKKEQQDSKRGGNRRSRGGRGRDDDQQQQDLGGNGSSPSPKDVAAMARTPKPEAEAEAETPEVDAPDTSDEKPAEKSAEKSGQKSRRKPAAKVEAEPDQPAEPTGDQSEAPDAPTDDAPDAASDAASGAASGPAEPVAPKVVTRTRTRSASRATKKPADTPADKPADRPTDEPAEVPADMPAEAAATAPVEAAAEPVAPKVVTRTRGRSASRPAGPPVGGSADDEAEPVAPTMQVGSIGAPPADGAVEPGTADTEVGTKPAVEHVPVKKRGSRKR